jgi:hypothetical protein
MHKCVLKSTTILKNNTQPRQMHSMNAFNINVCCIHASCISYFHSEIFSNTFIHFFKTVELTKWNF